MRGEGDCCERRKCPALRDGEGEAGTGVVGLDEGGDGEGVVEEIGGGDFGFEDIGSGGEGRFADVWKGDGDGDVFLFADGEGSEGQGEGVFKGHVGACVGVGTSDGVGNDIDGGLLIPGEEDGAGVLDGEGKGSRDGGGGGGEGGCGARARELEKALLDGDGLRGGGAVVGGGDFSGSAEGAIAGAVLEGGLVDDGEDGISAGEEGDWESDVEIEMARAVDAQACDVDLIFAREKGEVSGAVIGSVNLNVGTRAGGGSGVTGVADDEGDLYFFASAGGEGFGGEFEGVEGGGEVIEGGANAADGEGEIGMGGIVGEDVKGGVLGSGVCGVIREGEDKAVEADSEIFTRRTP